MHEILGFLWPIMAASAEGMLFFLMIVILIIVGRGKILPSEHPIIIDRTGRYKMELAPGLNLAQAFIEAVAEQVTLQKEANQKEFTLHYKVKDKNIASRKHSFYLLQVSSQNGYFSFTAKPFLPDTIYPKASSFANDEQEKIDDLENAILAVAKSWGVGLHRAEPEVNL